MNAPRKIIIVGGGTAGWMSANILSYAFQKKDFEITVLESPDIGTIGVGEGSTPALKVFFDRLHIDESEWMPACNATYKCGITFRHWSTKPGFESYYHPFASQIDDHTQPLFIHNAQTRLKGLDVDAHPDRFFLSAYLAKNNLGPLPHPNFPFDIHYGYHFDSKLLGQFLQRKAVARGVIHRLGTVDQINQRSDGRIDSLITKDQKSYTADLFVDCTGFVSLLSQKTLQTPYISYASQLFNDAAVAIPSQIDDVIPSQTISTALKFGWAWKIPLMNRFGNGYVYSSKYCSADAAETELRQHLNLLDCDVEARHLKMKVGRVEKSWHKNVLAVGLSQGFIEPLEATALLLIQQTVSLFAHYFQQGQFTNLHEDLFNQQINAQFDGTRDYIVSHYQTNSRDDTDYWRDNRDNPHGISDALAQVYQCWSGSQDLQAEILRLGLDRFYPVPSWYCLFSGMGIFPEKHQLAEPGNAAGHYSLKRIDEFLSRCTMNYDDHRTLLSKLGPEQLQAPLPIDGYLKL